MSRQVGNAVERNRVKRRLREAVRLSAADKFCAGHDYVLIGRRTALALPFGDMLRDLDAALQRVDGQGRTKFVAKFVAKFAPMPRELVAETSGPYIKRARPTASGKKRRRKRRRKSGNRHEPSP